MAFRPQLHTVLLNLLASVVIVVASGSPAGAQQPFITDDTDVTPRGHFHFEFSNQFNVLQRDAFPNLKQNTAEFEIDYGVYPNVEIGVVVPLLTIFNAADTRPKTVAGPGDTNVSLKYNFLTERENLRRPALAISLNLELPTGKVSNQLGSGLTDFYVNGILQKSLTKATKLRLNGGILFSGNETAGALGIRARGTVLTGGVSLVKQFKPRLQLGAEITGAVTRELQLDKGQLETTLGGNYQVKERISFDFAIVVGKYVASPRLGLQLGTSIDF